MHQVLIRLFPFRDTSVCNLRIRRSSILRTCYPPTPPYHKREVVCPECHFVMLVYQCSIPAGFHGIYWELPFLQRRLPSIPDAAVVPH